MDVEYVGPIMGPFLTTLTLLEQATENKTTTTLQRTGNWKLQDVSRVASQH
jgi:hypothetical protein